MKLFKVDEKGTGLRLEKEEMGIILKSLENSNPEKLGCNVETYLYLLLGFMLFEKDRDDFRYSWAFPYLKRMENNQGIEIIEQHREKDPGEQH
ncbi:hypothetical protein ES702_03943 [subsurface metagenome]